MYMVLTRDKARAHPIMTKAANLARSVLPAPRPANVRIANKDSQLLDAGAAAVEGRGLGLCARCDLYAGGGVGRACVLSDVVISSLENSTGGAGKR